MPRFNEQENPRDHRLAELAAIAQLYGAVSAPQERAAAEHQRSALEMLGLIMQAHTEQQRQAFQQQQLEQQGQRGASEQAFQRGELEQSHARTVGEEKYRAGELAARERSEANRVGEFWGAQYPLELQKAEDTKKMRGDEIAQRRQAVEWHDAEIKRQQALDQQNATMEAIKLATMQGVPIQKALELYGSSEQQTNAKHIHDQQIQEALPSATRDVREVFTHPAGPSREADWAMKREKNEGMDYVDFSNPALYAALPGAAATAPSTQLQYPTSTGGATQLPHWNAEDVDAPAWQKKTENAARNYVANPAIDLLNVLPYLGNVASQGIAHKDLFGYIPKYKQVQ